jgi:hypothetical protein
MVLGMMSDLDEYVDEALSEVSDWELNFKVGAYGAGTSSHDHDLKDDSSRSWSCA